MPGSSPAITYDPDALAYFTAAGITDFTQKQAYNTLVLTLKSYSIYSKMFALYPFLGGTASSHKWNAINPLDTDGAFRIVWNGTVTHDANGVQGNGSTGYGDTKFNASSGGWLADSASMHVYIRNNTASGYDFAASASPASNTSVLIARYTASTTAYGWLKNNAAGVNAVNADSRGMYSLVRGAADSLVLYKNGASLVSGSPSAGSYYNGNLYLGCENRGGVATEFSGHQYAFAAVGLTLNATESANLYTAVQAFQTALGRNV